MHGHPGAFCSGVYWVDDGGRQDDVSIGGDLEFPDPRGMMPSVYNATLRMRIDGCLQHHHHAMHRNTRHVSVLAYACGAELQRHASEGFDCV
nr:hypothetical protein [Pseudomonas syringae]